MRRARPRRSYEWAVLRDAVVGFVVLLALVIAASLVEVR